MVHAAFVGCGLLLGTAAARQRLEVRWQPSDPSLLSEVLDDRPDLKLAEIAAPEPDVETEPSPEPLVPAPAPIEPAGFAPPEPRPESARAAAAPTPDWSAQVVPHTEAPPPPAPESDYVAAVPDPTENPPPAYPLESRRRREEGTVWVRLSVDAEGVVQSAELAQSSGFPRLDRAALAALRSWRFLPARRNGRAEPATIDQPVVFKMVGGTAPN